MNTSQIERGGQPKTTEEWSQKDLLVRVHIIIEQYRLSERNHSIEDDVAKERIPCHACGGRELSADLCVFC